MISVLTVPLIQWEKCAKSLKEHLSRDISIFWGRDGSGLAWSYAHLSKSSTICFWVSMLSMVLLRVYSKDNAISTFSLKSVVSKGDLVFLDCGQNSYSLHWWGWGGGTSKLWVFPIEFFTFQFVAFHIANCPRKPSGLFEYINPDLPSIVDNSKVVLVSKPLCATKGNFKHTWNILHGVINVDVEEICLQWKEVVELIVKKEWEVIKPD